MVRILSSLKAVSLLPFLLLAACATAPDGGTAVEEAQPEEQSTTAPERDEQVPDEDTAETAAAEDEARSESRPRGLHGDSLYRLLVADFAGRRGDVNLALQGYLEAARAESDPRIAERAARLAVYAGRMDAALEAGRRWAELAPDSREAHAMLARLHLREGNADEALVHLRRVIALTEGGADAGLREVAALFDGTERPGAALPAASMLADEYPDRAIAYEMVADLAHRAGEGARALAAVERALDLDPARTRALILRARILIERDRTEEAFTGLEAAVEDAPGDRELALGYVRLLVEAERNEAAIRAMQRTFERFGDHASAVYSLGLLAMQVQAWDDAKIYLQRLVAMDARTASAHYYLGRIAEQDGDCTGALRHYIKVGRGDHRFDAELRAAVCMAEVDRVDEARLHLERLASRYRDDQPSTRITLTRARVERIAGNPDQALNIMGNAVEGRPDSIELRYNRALMAAEMDRFELARSDLRHILDLEPDNARALNALGYMLADRDMQLQEARTMIERALEQNPEDAATLDSMGWVLYRLGQPREALQYLRSAWDRSRDAEIAAHLGEVLWATGAREEARAVWDEGRGLDNGSDVLKETVERLDP
ncbi:tetratricopeptide repeat protein [Halofilum ochraceum]|uniref:tetratricopeptide repeat protein n=1 Tax=Halofilum ochraceum TaxID=1611323 RepID=UPI000834AD01|nr:tetratricopeptide repeat protein [Halofilum ochraceum]